MVMTLTAATWAPHKASLLLAMSPSMAPNTSPSPPPQDHDQDGLLLLGDKHYALHGEIMMVVLIVVFVSFIVCLAVFPCLCRRAQSVEDDSVAKPPNCCFSLCNSFIRKKRRTRDDDDVAEPELPLSCSNEITRKSDPP